MLLKQIAKKQIARPIGGECIRLYHPPTAKLAQIVRAVLFGLLFAFVFLWALPQSHVLFAGGAGSISVALLHSS